jgi:PTH1 family peptidyl-tRNA hydrolase
LPQSAAGDIMRVAVSFSDEKISGSVRQNAQKGRVAVTRPYLDFSLKNERKTMFFQKNSGGPSWILLCLGNPGDQYENTRHNVGFMVADELAERQHVPIQKLKFKALTNLVTISGEKVLIMKPVTYMNLSGEAVRPAADFYKIPPDHVLVVSDDTALPIGKLRIRKSGSAGGHNGLKSIIQHLGTDQFPRVRVGVGEKPHPDYDLTDWVLGKFQGEDKKAMDAAVKRAADAIECILKDGFDRGMNRFNG